MLMIRIKYSGDDPFFITWCQAAAYYYNGLILDKDNQPSNYIVAVSCFLAAEELLAESRKACLSFCVAAPVTRFCDIFNMMFKSENFFYLKLMMISLYEGLLHSGVL